MEKMEFNKADIVRIWYNKPEVKFELIKFLKNREFAVIVPNWYNDHRKTVRNLRVHNVQSIDFIFNVMYLQRDCETMPPLNTYYSIATFRDGVPKSTLNFKNRDMSEWNKIAKSEIIAYDFFLDIDGAGFLSFDECLEDTKKIVDFLNSVKFPFQLVFSGRGFHIKTPYNYFFRYNCDTKRKGNIWGICKKIAKYLHDNYSELVDLSIYDARRFCKIPFSLAIYEDRINVCYPINSIEELNNFKLSDYDLDNFNKPIRDIPVVIWNADSSILRLIDKIEGDKHG